MGIGLKPPRLKSKEKFVRATCDRIPDDIHIHGWALRGFANVRRLDSMDSTNWFRDALQLRMMRELKHLTFGEALEIIVKRYQREDRVITAEPAKKRSGQRSLDFERESA